MWVWIIMLNLTKLSTRIGHLQLPTDKIIHTSQDKSREFFFLFTYICANNIVFLFVFIYKGDSGLL